MLRAHAPEVPGRLPGAAIGARALPPVTQAAAVLIAHDSWIGLPRLLLLHLRLAGLLFIRARCRHWLRGLCMKGDACGFLHQFDKARMPVCRFFRDFGECREPDCAYKHSYDDVKECNM